MSGIDRGRLAEPRHHWSDERETFGPALTVRGFSQGRASRLPYPDIRRDWSQVRDDRAPIAPRNRGRGN